MGRKRYTAEQIIGMLREAEVLQSQGDDWGNKSQAGHYGADLLPLA